MNISFLDKNLEKIAAKVIDNNRLDFNDGVTLYKSSDIIGIGSIADYVKTKLHNNCAYFVYNQHINYTNICSSKCKFCAFAKDRGETGAFTFSIKEIEGKLKERIDEPVREIHVVGGINSELSIDYYTDLIKTIKKIRPNAVVKAFTAVEIDNISKISGLDIENTISVLKDAGLEMMPGGGAEIMSSRVRKKLFPNKISAPEWLDVMKIAHRAGIVSNATMLYGHIETIEERVRHLIKLRELQDKTNGFSAFIPLAFHSKNTSMSDIDRTTGIDDLKNIAVARLMLDNFAHIKAYWVMIGEKLAQVALSFGADDLDGTIIEEKITHMAGAETSKGLSREKMLYLIKSAGKTPIERDSFYNPV